MFSLQGSVLVVMTEMVPQNLILKTGTLIYPAHSSNIGVTRQHVRDWGVILQVEPVTPPSPRINYLEILNLNSCCRS
jgi:hypothetical protein